MTDKPNFPVGTILQSECKTYTGEVVWKDINGWCVVRWDKWGVGHPNSFVLPLFSHKEYSKVVYQPVVLTDNVKKVRRILLKALEEAYEALLDDTNQDSLEDDFPEIAKAAWDSLKEK